MEKVNKKFEIFLGWVVFLFVTINIIFPIAGIITGVLLMSQNYFSLILVVLGYVAVAGILTAIEINSIKRKN